MFNNQFHGQRPHRDQQSSNLPISLCASLLPNHDHRQAMRLVCGRIEACEAIIILMNFSYPLTPSFASPEEAALYYNSYCFQYDYLSEMPQANPAAFFPSPQNFAFLSSFQPEVRRQAEKERPTDDMDSFREPEQPMVKLEVKMEELSPKSREEVVPPSKPAEEEPPELQLVKEKNLKKNTESNLINNVFSYICSEPKSFRVVRRLIQGEKMKIFYIFANNLKRINGKYLNRKNIKAVCEIVPKQQRFKMLSKSIKRLLILPIPELRSVLRKVIFHYLRGPESLLPLLTSKKICKIAIQEHMARRRDLARYIATMLTPYN